MSKIQIVKSSLLFFVIVLWGFNDRIQPTSSQGLAANIVNPGMLQVGEELEYKVSYSIFNLGSIKVKVIGKRSINGITFFDSEAFMDSSPGLPFINLHVKFYSKFAEQVYSTEFISDDSSAKTIETMRYIFSGEQKKGIIYFGTKIPDGKRKITKVTPIFTSGYVQDGLSLFYFARSRFRQRMTMNVPTFVGYKEENTYINFKNEISGIQIDAVDYPIEVNYFDGEANFVGIFGLTGGFKGWFSNDEAGIPILARMNVILGSVKIELIKWKRSGWVPPRYNETARR